jgi:hypothetical protein
MLATLSATTSMARSPAPYATLSIALDFADRAVSSSRWTSSGGNTRGNFLGS